MAKSLKQRDEIEGLTKDKLKDLISFTIEEMLAQVDTDAPLVAHQREKLDNERIMIKQLVANIERNRVKWR